MNSRSPRALLNIRGFVRTETSGLPLSPLAGAMDEAAPSGLGPPTLLGTFGSRIDLEEVEGFRLLGSGAELVSSRSHSLAIPRFRQFEQGLMPLHFFFRCLHGRHALTALTRSSGATFFRGIRARSGLLRFQTKSAGCSDRYEAGDVWSRQILCVRTALLRSNSPPSHYRRFRRSDRKSGKSEQAVG